MPTLLHVDASPMGEFSISRNLTREFVAQWRAANPQCRVIVRDLTTTAIPVITAAWVAANLKPKHLRNEEEEGLLSLSSQLTGELLEADEYIIGVPMHNWGPAASFKLWVDQLVRFGEILEVTPDGPKGKLVDKRATFIVAAGSLYGQETGDSSKNYLEPWLRSFFGYLGLKKMDFLLAEGAVAVRYGKIDLSSFLTPHIESIRARFAEAPSR